MQKMHEFELHVVERSSEDVRIILAEKDGAAYNAKAQMDVNSKQSVNQPFRETTLTYGDLINDGTIFELDNSLTETSIEKFASFRNADVRSTLLDHAYSFLMSKIVPQYEDGTINIEDDVLIIEAKGMAVGGLKGPKDQKARATPRRNKQKIHSWF